MELVCTIVMKEEEKLELYATVSSASALYIIAMQHSVLYTVSPDRECNESDIRLVNGKAVDDGRVEICLDGGWGSVCYDRWDIRDAEVVCRQLGYNGCESLPLFSLFPITFCYSYQLLIPKYVPVVVVTHCMSWTMSSVLVLRPNSVTAVTVVLEYMTVTVEKQGLHVLVSYVH